MDSMLKVVLLIALCQEGSFDPCPPPALWEIVATDTCQENTYFHCLLNDRSKTFVNMCFKPVLNPAGSSIVLDGFLNAERCRDDRYQPRPYWSNEFYTCVYKKSLCNEEGQVIESNGPGTLTTDRTCRCDYRKGYAFLTPPINPCFCVPSKEDCGCYLKTCPNTSFFLSSDYECEIDQTKTTTCPLIAPPSLPPTTGDDTSYRVLEYDINNYNIKRVEDMDKVYQVIVTVIVIAAILGILFIGVIGVLRQLCERSYNDKLIVLQPSTIKRLTSKEIRHLKEQKIFIPTNGLRKAQTALKDKNVTILKGRYGTGKTSTALMLASYYKERSYEAYKFDKPNIDMIKQLIVTTKRRVIILENIIGDMLQATTDFNEWKNVLSVLFHYREKTKIILTTYLINLELWGIFIQNISRPEDAFVDLDKKDALTIEEKKSMLQEHSSKYGRNIIHQDIDEIVRCETIIGFPLVCCLFCINDLYFGIGKRYFTQIPIALLEKLEILRGNGISNAFEGIKFCVLVYIALSKEHHVRLHECCTDDTMFKTIFHSVYKNIYIHDTSYLKNAAITFRDQYLEYNENDEFTFVHPIIKRAVQITYGRLYPKHVIDKAAVDDLLNIVRPETYSNNRNEPLLLLHTQDEYHAFAKRIGCECYASEVLARTIGKYVKEYGLSNNDIFLLQCFLESVNKIYESNKTNNYIHTIITIFEEITCDSSYRLPKEIKPIAFRLSWEILCAAKTNKEDTLHELIQLCLDSGEQDEILFCIMDEFNNTLLHYLVIWNYDDSLRLLNKRCSLKASNVKNKFNFTPVYFAANLARSKYLQQLLERNEKGKTIFKSMQSRLGRKLENLLSGLEQGQFINLWELLVDGAKKHDQVLSSEVQVMLTFDATIIPSVKYGGYEDYKTSKQILLEFYTFAKKFLKKSGKDLPRDNAIEENIEEEFEFLEHEAIDGETEQ